MSNKENEEIFDEEEYTADAEEETGGDDSVASTKLWQFAVGTAMVILAAVWNLGRYSDMLQTIIIGIGSYWGLGYIFQKVPIGKGLKKIVEYLAGISYAFFLTHHYLLEWLTARFCGITLERAEVYLLYTGCFVVTVLVSTGLVNVNRAVLRIFTEK